MIKALREALRLDVAYGGGPAIIKTDDSEAGAWLRYTQRYGGGAELVLVRPIVSLQ
jgi:uncharacterized protein YfaP (DUF2135 family)